MANKHGYLARSHQSRYPEEEGGINSAGALIRKARSTKGRSARLRSRKRSIPTTEKGDSGPCLKIIQIDDEILGGYSRAGFLSAEYVWSVLKRSPHLGGTLLISYAWGKCLSRRVNTIRQAELVVSSAHGTPGGDDGKKMVLCPILGGGDSELGLKRGVLRTCSAVGLTTISADDDLEVGMDCSVWNWDGLGNAKGSHGYLMASEKTVEGRVCSGGSEDRVISSLVPGLCRDM
jgi:hypothetical protein